MNIHHRASTASWLGNHSGIAGEAGNAEIHAMRSHSLMAFELIQAEEREGFTLMIGYFTPVEGMR